MNQERTCTFFQSVRASNCARHTILSTYPQKTERKSTQVRTVTLEEIFARYPFVEGVKMDIEGAEVLILEEQTYMPSRLRWLVLEYSFDFFMELSRFKALVKHLELWFIVETSVDDGVLCNFATYPTRP